MRNRGGQVDVTHALATLARGRDHDPTLVTNNAHVLLPTVLATGALIVTLRAKDPLAEQAVLFRAEGAVVDGLGLLDLAKGRRTEVLG